MMSRRVWSCLLLVALVPLTASAQTNPLWQESKIKNYLPHMSWPEVQDLLTRTDMVIIPVGSIEEHGPQLPEGTDFLNGLERALLIAQKTDVLVAPILLPGNSPYHMEFPGTITLPAELIQEVYVEASRSLIRHGFRRFLLLNSHGGNQTITRFIVDRLNQETEAIAVDLGDAAAPFQKRAPRPRSPVFDRHAGVGETSDALYLLPSLVNLSAARATTLTLPDHLQKMLPEVVAGDPTAQMVFLAEALKAKETGKHTSTREMTPTGVWSLRDPKEATVDQGRESVEAFTAAAVAFIERWKALRPLEPAGQ